MQKIPIDNVEISDHHDLEDHIKMHLSEKFQNQFDLLDSNGCSYTIHILYLSIPERMSTTAVIQLEADDDTLILWHLSTGS